MLSYILSPYNGPKDYLFEPNPADLICTSTALCYPKGKHRRVISGTMRVLKSNFSSLKCSDMSIRYTDIMRPDRRSALPGKIVDLTPQIDNLASESVKEGIAFQRATSSVSALRECIGVLQEIDFLPSSVYALPFVFV